MCAITSKMAMHRRKERTCPESSAKVELSSSCSAEWSVPSGLYPSAPRSMSALVQISRPMGIRCRASAWTISRARASLSTTSDKAFDGWGSPQNPKSDGAGAFFACGSLASVLRCVKLRGWPFVRASEQEMDFCPAKTPSRTAGQARNRSSTPPYYPENKQAAPHSTRDNCPIPRSERHYSWRTNAATR